MKDSIVPLSAYAIAIIILIINETFFGMTMSLLNFVSFTLISLGAINQYIQYRSKRRE